MSLTSFLSSSFAPAFLLLPAERRRALQAVYAFARAVDDAVDVVGEADPNRARHVLADWRASLAAIQTAEAPSPADESVWLALQKAVQDYGIDTRHLLDLLDGVGRDLHQKRYKTFEELTAYCDGVASSVGLACLSVFRLDAPSHHDFAVNLGRAVQMTNILRDVKTDAARDRIYLPEEDLKRFGVGENDILEGRYDEHFTRLMRFEGKRARDFYAAARRSLPPISARAARPAVVMGRLYERILDKLEAADFHPGADRPRLNFFEKISCIFPKKT